MTQNTIERAARALCENPSEDPDELISMSDGSQVARWKSQVWRVEAVLNAIKSEPNDEPEAENLEAMPDAEMARLTGEWMPVLPRAYEKSVVLGGGLVLFPISDPKAAEAVLKPYVIEIARRAYRAGRRAAKAEIRGVLHGD